VLQRVDHVAFNVSDMQRAVDFFTRVLGFTEAGRWRSEQEGAAEIRFVTLGASVVELVERRDMDKVDTSDLVLPGFNHICLRSDDLDTYMIQMAGRGAVFLGPEMHVDERLYVEERPMPGYCLERGFRRILVKGPDGIVVEIMERRE